MTDRLRELYDDLFFKRCEPTPAYSKICDKEELLWDKVRPVLSRETIERLQGVQEERLLEANFEWFQEGFRLGAALMLELI